MIRMMQWTPFREQLGRFVAEIPDLSLTDASAALAAARELANDLAIVMADLGARVAKLRPPKPRDAGTFVENVGTVKVRAPRPKQVWDDAELVDAVVARARDERRVDPDTGEIEDPFVTARRVFESVWPLTGTAARIGKAAVRGPDGRVEVEGSGLKGLGIDPDEYRAYVDQPGKPPTVEVVA